MGGVQVQHSARGDTGRQTPPYAAHQAPARRPGRTGRLHRVGAFSTFNAHLLVAPSRLRRCRRASARRLAFLQLAGEQLLHEALEPGNLARELLRLLPAPAAAAVQEGQLVAALRQLLSRQLNCLA